jgi:hypothetical protein
MNLELLLVLLRFFTRLLALFFIFIILEDEWV